MGDFTFSTDVTDMWILSGVDVNVELYLFHRCDRYVDSGRCGCRCGTSSAPC